MNANTLVSPLENCTVLVKQFLQMVAASFFIAFCAQISALLPFTPVPFTFLTLSIMLVGTTLGSRLGALSVVTYLVEGAFGLPVFFAGGSGFAVLLGPRGGYLLGCVLMAYLAGCLAERRFLSRTGFCLGLCGICALQLAMGCLWLAQFLGWSKAFFVGFFPFIPGEIIKSAIITKYFSKGQ